ncbi:hypothetical protein BH10PSE3_BH10PSE3_09230 [soil metagenome]
MFVVVVEIAAPEALNTSLAVTFPLAALDQVWPTGKQTMTKLRSIVASWKAEIAPGFTYWGSPRRAEY